VIVIGATKAATDSGSAPQVRASRFPLYAQIVLALFLGLVVGPLLGSRAGPLGEIGKVVVNLIKAVAAPLLFFAIVDAVVRTEIQGRAALRLLFWAFLNATIALAIGLSVSNWLEPGRHLSALATPGAAGAYADKRINLLGLLNGFVPSSLVAPFVENAVLAIVVLAVLFGLALRAIRAEQFQSDATGHRVLEQAVSTLLRLMEIVLGWVIRLIPFAVFGVVAKAVGEHGYAPFRGLAWYVVVGVGGMILHVCVTYQVWLALVVRMNLRSFWREAKEPVSFALGANSSLASLPVTLRALDRLGVPRSASTLGACVGTNFNNDGIILYEGMAVLFVAQASGIELSLAQQLLVAGACLVAAMGVAGVPEAGFVSLALVLNTAHLPLELLPLLLTVDWIVARARSAANVLSDMILSILIGRNEMIATPTTRP
jgi:Na+/H+-dicarboxylate symporter